MPQTTPHELIRESIGPNPQIHYIRQNQLFGNDSQSMELDKSTRCLGICYGCATRFRPGWCMSTNSGSGWPSQLPVSATDAADGSLPPSSHITKTDSGTLDDIGDSQPDTQLLEMLPIVKKPSEPPSPPLEIGQKLGPYRLHSIIGRGPHGVVYEADDTIRQVQVALKVIAPEVASAGPKWVKRFVDGAKLSLRISHRVILDILTLSDEGNRAYYAMPLLRGRSLAWRFQAEGAFPMPLATRVALKLLDLLAHIHLRGVTHCNIKPTNVFLDENEQVKLADFAVPVGESSRGTKVIDRLRQRIGIDLRQWANLYHRMLVGHPPTGQGEIDPSIPEPITRILRGILKREPGYSETAVCLQVLTEAYHEARGASSMKPASSPAICLESSSRPAEIEPGQTFGRCLILEPIGRGSVGRVFKARHMTLNIPVAIKVLNCHGNPEILHQFRTEAQLLARLNHPQIVRVWDFDDDPKHPYLVIEYVEGETLADVIREAGRLPAGRALQIIGQMADGLAAAHRVGIIHRDIKPSNVLLTPDGNSKLVDLGLAVWVEPDVQLSSQGMVGTVAYMAPEQAQGQKIDHRADFYSLGATFYHAITGHMPFPGSTPAEVLRAHVSEPLVPAHYHVPGLPEPVSEVIARMMAKSPNDRQPSDGELLNDLMKLDRLLNPLSVARGPSWRTVPMT